MTWRYVVSRQKVTDPMGAETDYFAIRELFYPSEGRGLGWTENPIDPGAETIEELVESLHMMMRDTTQPILDLSLDPPALVERKDL